MKIELTGGSLGPYLLVVVVAIVLVPDDRALDATSANRGASNEEELSHELGREKRAAKSASSSSYTNDCYKAINELRAKHGMNPLKVDTKVEKYAQGRANELVRTRIFAHPQHSDYGENLAWASIGGALCSSPVNDWYNEIKDYDFKRPSFSSEVGHFTQLVWKGTKKVGCARGDTSSGEMYLVCNFDPPGNILGEFRENVTPVKKGGGNKRNMVTTVAPKKKKKKTKTTTTKKPTTKKPKKSKKTTTASPQKKKIKEDKKKKEEKKKN